MDGLSFSVCRDLADTELLCLVLEASPRLAVALLEDLGGVEGLARVGFGELAQMRGVGEGRARRVVAALELGRRAASRHPALPWLPDSDAVHAWARRHFDGLVNEELWVLALDGQNRARAARRVAVGGLHGLAVSTRDILRLAVKEGASAIIAVHNHPSGDPAPSVEDIRFTERLAAAADVLGTPLVDHVIVAGDRHRSLLEDGLLSGKARAAVAPVVDGIG